MNDLRVLSDQLDPRLMAARRTFPVSQTLLSGAATSTPLPRAKVGWYGTRTYGETGAAAIVREGHPLEEALVGSVVEVTRIEPPERRRVFVYVVAARPIEADLDLSLTRRAFFALGLLALETIDAEIGLLP